MSEEAEIEVEVRHPVRPFDVYYRNLDYLVETRDGIGTQPVEGPPLKMGDIVDVWSSGPSDRTCWAEVVGIEAWGPDYQWVDLDWFEDGPGQL